MSQLLALPDAEKNLIEVETKPTQVNSTPYSNEN
jgi:hypothetical protein